MGNKVCSGETEYDFYIQCDPNNNNVNKVGVFPQNKIEKVLQCNENKQWIQFFIPEIVDIPCEKPDVEGVVSVHASVEIISQRVIKTPTVTGYTASTGEVILGESIPNAEGTKLTGRKLIVEGFLKQKIIYTATDDQQSLHSAHFIVPFSVFIIIEKNTPFTRTFNVVPYIEDIYVLQLSERSIFKNTTIFIKATPAC